MPRRTPQRRPRWVLWAAVLLVSGAAPEVDGARAARRVVLLVLRGTSFESAPASVAGGARPLLPIDGAVTAAALGTLFTGAAPATHGLVGNVFREGFGGDELNAFEQRLLAEPLWEAVERQGRRVVALNLRMPGQAHADVVAWRVQRPETMPGSHAATPASFARELDTAVGRPPGAADLPGLLAGKLDAPAFVAQVERWARHRRADVVHVLRRLKFDLLIVDENVVDALLHPFTGRDESHVALAYRLADETLRAVLAALPDDAVLVTVSPYGMAPVRSAVSVRRVLEAGGFALDGTRAHLRVAAYGPVAHVYLAPGGDPAPVEALLRAARDGATGEPLFARVERRGATARLPLFHPLRGGDLVVLARPGGVLSAEPEPQSPRFPGDHGHAADSPGARGFVSLHVRGRPRVLPQSMKDVDVAPSVACLLGVDPPRAARAAGRGRRPRPDSTDCFVAAPAD